MKSRQSILSILFLTTFLFACDSPTWPGGDWSVADYDRAWNMIDSLYPYLEFKDINWEAVRTTTRPGPQDEDSESVYWATVDMLLELRDGHVYIEADGSRYLPYNVPRRERDQEAFSPDVVTSYFDRELRSAVGGDILYQIHEDNIGYIYISSLVSESLPTAFETVMAHVMNTDGIIFDVRHNGGGSARNSNEIVKWFISAPMQKPVAYHDGQPLNFSPLEPHHTTYDNNVVVLINGASFSEAERFAEMMKQVPTVTVVGDTTGGGSCGGGDRFALPNASVISFGTYDYRRYDGQPWEWSGIPPDIRVAQTENDMKQGRDPQLEYALSLLR
jgi:hypothetical protein